MHDKKSGCQINTVKHDMSICYSISMRNPLIKVKIRKLADTREKFHSSLPRDAQLRTLSLEQVILQWRILSDSTTAVRTPSNSSEYPDIEKSPKISGEHYHHHEIKIALNYRRSYASREIRIRVETVSGRTQAVTRKQANIK